MNIYTNISTIASLIGDSTRTTILCSLSDGRALTAGELAFMAKVSPQTASTHLSKLVEGGLLTVESQGRHRYYRISSPKVVDVIEAISALAPPAPVRSLRESGHAKSLQFARTCYDHLAGYLGVSLTHSLIQKGFIEETEHHFLVTSSGLKWLEDFGVKSIKKNHSDLIIPRHIDWTERVPHLGGPIAVKITKQLLELGWITNGKINRSIEVTEKGKVSFLYEFGINL